MTDNERELWAAVYARLEAIEDKLVPQTMRHRLERTFDPRGDEPRIITPAGATLDYAPAIQFTGDFDVTVNAPERRIEVGLPASTPTAELQWVDTFDTDLFPAPAGHYRDVVGLSVAGGVVSWNPAATNGGYAVKTGLWFNTVQSVKFSQTSNPATMKLMARVRSMPASPGIELHWNTGTGALTVYDSATATVLATAAGTVAAASGTNYWLMFAVVGDRAYGAVLSVAPSALSTAAQVLAAVSVSLADGLPYQLVMDQGVGFQVLCSGTPTVAVDDYQIWRV